MTSTQQPAQLEASIEIDAPPAQVWALISDPRRMAAFSPQVVRTFVRGKGPVAKGTKFFNLNHRGPLMWPTQAEVVRCEPHTEFAFRVKENWTIWSFTLEPTAAGGTRVVQRRETPKGISKVSLGLTKVALGGVPTFTGELEQGMQETLGKIKAAAER
jgi:uncharacterized protein YndB with AHSA1/START domain